MEPRRCALADGDRGDRLGGPPADIRAGGAAGGAASRIAADLGTRKKQCDLALQRVESQIGTRCMHPRVALATVRRILGWPACGFPPPSEHTAGACRTPSRRSARASGMAPHRGGAGLGVPLRTLDGGRRSRSVDRRNRARAWTPVGRCTPRASRTERALDLEARGVGPLIAIWRGTSSVPFHENLEVSRSPGS